MARNGLTCDPAPRQAAGSRLVGPNLEESSVVVVGTCAVRNNRDVITWNSNTLYGVPTPGVCQVSGKYETGRIYIKNGKPFFVGNTEAPKCVEQYVEFLTALQQVTGFKRGYAKSEWIAKKI